MSDLLILGGSTRAFSYSRSIAQLIGEGAERAGLRVDFINLGELYLPPYKPDTPIDSLPREQRDFVERVRTAGAMIWCSPAYHGSVSGVFKNALDYLDLLKLPPDNFLAGKAVGIVAVGSGRIAVVNACSTMLFIAQALRAVVHPHILPIPMIDDLIALDGSCCDPALAAQLYQFGASVSAMSTSLRGD